MTRCSFRGECIIANALTVNSQPYVRSEKRLGNCAPEEVFCAASVWLLGLAPNFPSLNRVRLQFIVRNFRPSITDPYRTRGSTIDICPNLPAMQQ